jgi:hypothetical protein
MLRLGTSGRSWMLRLESVYYFGHDVPCDIILSLLLSSNYFTCPRACYVSKDRIQNVKNLADTSI